MNIDLMNTIERYQEIIETYSEYMMIEDKEKLLEIVEELEDMLQLDDLEFKMHYVLTHKRRTDETKEIIEKIQKNLEQKENEDYFGEKKDDVEERSNSENYYLKKAKIARAYNENTEGIQHIIFEEKNLPNLLFYDELVDGIKKKMMKTNNAIEKAKKYGLPALSNKKGFLIKGNIGVGKTTITNEIAKKVFPDKKIVRKSAAEFISKYVGESSQKARDIVKEAKGNILVVSNFASWTSHKNEEHELEPMGELVNAIKETEHIVLIFEGTNKEIEDIFTKMPEMKTLFSETIELADYKMDHLVELFELKLKQNKAKLDENVKPLIFDYFKSIKGANGHNVSEMVKEIVIQMLENQNDMFVTEKTIKSLDNFVKKPKQSDATMILEESKKELEKMVGQEEVKKTIKRMLNLSIVQKKRKEKNLKEVKTTRHMIFSGSPGTGKTTIARVVAKMYAASGIIETGQFVEVTIDQLTKSKNVANEVKRAVNSAIGGVLFIDEAYALLKTVEGRQALDALIPLIENRREEFICILAGYKEDMDDLKKANVGLKSRMREVTFRDYNNNELLHILMNIFQENQYTLSNEVVSELKNYISSNHFNGNGRAMRNLFDELIENQAERIIESEEEGELDKIILEDIFKLKYEQTRNKEHSSV